jgi:hypothetical protein
MLLFIHSKKQYSLKNERETTMTPKVINTKIQSGTIIKICPWDTAFTNQASATVLSVGDNRTAYYQVDGCEATISRQVSFSTWRSIVAQAAK